MKKKTTWGIGKIASFVCAFAFCWFVLFGVFLFATEIVFIFAKCRPAQIGGLAMLLIASIILSWEGAKKLEEKS
ncbi:MAG: hypothetical protein K1Y02_25985 [Candidatus Hydrogenedentes bacterium]|nr:hypothetical protein [Candidatus Hydrogenedentota bacterium]